MTHDQAQIALSVERALRAAARAGNRLLAGGTALLLIEAGATRCTMRAALARMGVREASAGSPADFVFIDGGSDTYVGESVPAHGLPAVVVSLTGDVVSPRGLSAADRIAWAERGMPATATLARELARGVNGAASDAANGNGRRNSAAAPRVAVSLVLEPKTAAFTRTLAAAGCEVAVFSAVSETDPEIARELAADGRVAVFAPTSDTPEDTIRAVDAQHAAGILDWAPDYLIDDGSHLIRLAHTERPAALERLLGAAEETTSGVRPLIEMAAAGELRVPVIAVNDARTKTGFDNLIGTGQSCVFAIADLLDAAGWRAPGTLDAPEVPAAVGYAGVYGTRWVVVGYGPVGVGTARFAAALGARVTVVEHDPVRALAALHDGFEARGMAEALASADVVVSATGVWHTIDEAHFRAMRPGTAVAVAGGIDDELALDTLRAAGWTHAPAASGVSGASSSDGVDEWRAPGEAAGPIVLAWGGGVNYTASEGNPIEVMDLSFATQLAALARLMRERPEPGVHALSAGEERAVARAALAPRGGDADPDPQALRAGGAAQPWRVHRYRAQTAGGDAA